MTRRLPGYAADPFREALAAMCAAHVGRGSGDRPPLPHLEIQTGHQTITAADPLPADLHEALTEIDQAGGAH